MGLIAVSGLARLSAVSPPATPSSGRERERERSSPRTISPPGERGETGGREGERAQPRRPAPEHLGEARSKLAAPSSQPRPGPLTAPSWKLHAEKKKKREEPFPAPPFRGVHPVPPFAKSV